jgi:hypothetical protein
MYKQLGDLLTKGEGNYESYNTGTINKKVVHSFPNRPAGTVTGKTIYDIIASNNLPATDPRRFFASGKYQITIPTLADAVAAMKLNGQEKFTPAMQERIFREFLLPKRAVGLNNYVNYNEDTVGHAQASAAPVWSSIAVPAGNGLTDTKSYYESDANHANLNATRHFRDYLQNLWAR